MGGALPGKREQPSEAVDPRFFWRVVGILSESQSCNISDNLTDTEDLWLEDLALV